MEFDFLFVLLFEYIHEQIMFPRQIVLDFLFGLLFESFSKTWFGSKTLVDMEVIELLLFPLE